MSRSGLQRAGNSVDRCRVLVGGFVPSDRRPSRAWWTAGRRRPAGRPAAPTEAMSSRSSVSPLAWSELRSSPLFSSSVRAASGWSATTWATSPSEVCDSEIRIVPSEAGESGIRAWRRPVARPS